MVVPSPGASVVVELSSPASVVAVTPVSLVAV
jgi:hypothetical protein